MSDIQEMSDSPFTVIIGSKEKSLFEESLIIKRCQVESCEPEFAFEDCFYVKTNNYDDDLTIENIGYGKVTVIYNIQNNSAERVFELPKKAEIQINGNVKFIIKQKRFMFLL